MRRFRRPAPLLLPGSLYMDVPRRGAALHYAGGGIRERALTPTILLPGWVRRASAHCGCLSGSGLPQLWNRKNVSANERLIKCIMKKQNK